MSRPKKVNVDIFKFSFILQAKQSFGVEVIVISQHRPTITLPIDKKGGKKIQDEKRKEKEKEKGDVFKILVGNESNEHID